MSIPDRNNKRKSREKGLILVFQRLKDFWKFFWVSTAVHPTSNDLVKLGIKIMQRINLG